MNDMSSVPLRGQQSNTSGRERSAVPPNAGPIPSTDPSQILAKNQPAKDPRKSKVRIMMMIGGGLLAMQLLAPQPLRPFYLAGSAAAEFYGAIMATSQLNNEVTAHQAGIAQRLAAMEADYADSRAKCFWGQLLSPEAGELCTQLVDANFVPAIRQLRRQLSQ